MTDSGAAEALALVMSVEEYFVAYERSTTASEPGKRTGSAVQVFMHVKGAPVEHHQNRPISRADILFLEGELEINRVGSLDADPADTISCFTPGCLWPTSLGSGLPSAWIGSPAWSALFNATTC
jgi:hypothetical protein